MNGFKVLLEQDIVASEFKIEINGGTAWAVIQYGGGDPYVLSIYDDMTGTVSSDISDFDNQLTNSQLITELQDFSEKNK